MCGKECWNARRKKEEAFIFFKSTFEQLFFGFGPLESRRRRQQHRHSWELWELRSGIASKRR